LLQSLKVRHENENSSISEVQLAIQFLNAKNVHLVEIHRQIVHVYGEGAVSEGSMRKCVSCSKKAGHMCMMRKKSRCTNSSSGKFSSMLHTVPTLHRVISKCFSTSRNFWLARVWGMTDQRQVGLSERLGNDLF
jgi:hypothetical protein